MAKPPPWKRANPKRKPTKLTAKSKTSARAHARRAGRPYPSLVDNMNAAKHQKAGGATKAKSTAKKSTAKKSTAKKSTAKKSPATKRRGPARKAPAKRTARSKS